MQLVSLLYQDSPQLSTVFFTLLRSNRLTKPIAESLPLWYHYAVVFILSRTDRKPSQDAIPRTIRVLFSPFLATRQNPPPFPIRKLDYVLSFLPFTRRRQPDRP